MIRKVISGGQTGADIAALRAAKSLGITTGGTMPKGFRTLVGLRPDYAKAFGMSEHSSPLYPLRTFANVAESDITVCIAADFNSPGERLTAKACAKLGKPRATVPIFNGCSWREDDVSSAIGQIQLRQQLLGRDVVVNFAGNSERTAPGIEAIAQAIAGRILKGVNP